MNGRQRRWRGGVTAALVLATAGVVGSSGTLLLAATIPLAYVAISSVSRVPSPEAVTAHRRVEPRPARPGEAVTVTLTVTNESDRTLPDVRIADGVPEPLAVVEGSPRTGGTLQPGERTTISYRLVARRGEFSFSPPRVRARGIVAGAVATSAASTTGDHEAVCRLDADAPPLEDYGEGHVGPLRTDEPGEGLAFHSIREYRPNDPAGRIDWRHYAKRGELSTVDYERAVPATVVIVLDARRPNFVVASEGRPTAVELQAYAATRAVTDLLGSGQEVGVAILGLDGPGPAGLYWLPPAAGLEQRSLALDLFRTATEATPADLREDATQRHRLLELLPAGAQLALFSPLLDDAPVTAVETWCGADCPVTILSPDVLTATTVSGQYAQTRRRTRLAQCQGAGAKVFDWRRGTPLVLAIEQAFATEARVSSDRLSGGVA